ncbi:hypothetical protein SALBM217S_05775 [Streptomyces griseoloalbus]
MQGAAEPRHREERQLSAHVHVMDAALLLVRDPGPGEPVQGHAHGHGNAEHHALQHPEADHPEGGDGVDQHLAVARHRADVVQGHHPEADRHHQGGERGERDQLQQRDQEQCGRHHQQAVNHRGVPADGARVDVRRAADGDPGHRQTAEGAGDDVRRALTEQFPVQVGADDMPRAGPGGRQLVHGHRAEQRLHAAHQRRGQHGRGQTEHRAFGQPRQRMAAPRRQVHDGQHQSGRRGDRGGAGDSDERGRHPPQHASGAAGQPGPEQQGGQGQHAHREGGRVEARQLGGQGLEVVGHGALRLAPEDDVRLGDGNGDADAGEHAVHDRGTHGEGAARHAQTAEPQLDESGEDGDGAGDAPAVLVDEVGGDDREPRRRSAHLERGAAEPSGDEPAHRRGDQAGLEGRARGERDAEGQGEGDEEDRDGGREVGARDAEAGAAAVRRAVRGVGSFGVRRFGGTGGNAG